MAVVPMHPTEPVNLRAERLRRGMSQAQLAAAAAVSVDVVRGAEDGRRPTPANAVKLAAYFGVDVLVQWPLSDGDDAP